MKRPQNVVCLKARQEAPVDSTEILIYSEIRDEWHGFQMSDSHRALDRLCFLLGQQYLYGVSTWLASRSPCGATQGIMEHGISGCVWAEEGAKHC